MEMPKLTVVHKQRIALAAFAVATLLLLDCLYQVAMHLRWQLWMPSTLVMEEPAAKVPDAQSPDQRAADVEEKSSETQAGDAEGKLSETQQADAAESFDRLESRSHREAEADGGKGETPPEAKSVSDLLEAAITKRNIMAKPKPKKVDLIGVLGKIALLKTATGKTVGIEEGKSAQGIKVVSIDGYQVTIEHHGKTETKKLFPEKKKDQGPSSPSGAPPAATGPDSAAHDKGKTGSDETSPQTDSAETSGEKVGQRSSLPSDRKETSSNSKGENQ